MHIDRTKYFTADEAAEFLRVHVLTVRRYAKTGHIGKRINGRWWFDRKELAEFVKIPRPTGPPRKTELP